MVLFMFVRIEDSYVKTQEKYRVQILMISTYQSGPVLDQSETKFQAYRDSV